MNKKIIEKNDSSYHKSFESLKFLNLTAIPQNCLFTIYYEYFFLLYKNSYLQNHFRLLFFNVFIICQFIIFTIRDDENWKWRNDAMSSSHQNVAVSFVIVHQSPPFVDSFYICDRYYWRGRKICNFLSLLKLQPCNGRRNSYGVIRKWECNKFWI